MEIKFGKSEGAAPAPVVEMPAPVQQPIEAPAASVPATVPKMETALARPNGLLVGDKLPDLSEIILPRINIVQGIGGLKESFQEGALIFNQATVLFTPPILEKGGTVKQAALPPVSMTVLGFRPTRFVEKVEGGGRGAIYNTEDDVRANGGTLDYNEWKLKKASGIKRFEPLAEALIAIKRPECCKDDDTVFVYPVEEDGKTNKYALAIWGMKGVVYTAAAKRVFFTARQLGALRKSGYPSFNYNVTTKLEPFGTGNKAWVPVCLIGTANSAPFMDFVRGIIGG